MGLFSQKERTSIVLIDISSSSIGGALAHTSPNEQPLIYYSARINIEAREHEDDVTAMLRTLDEMAQVLLTKGAPVLRQETGSGHIDRILVSVCSPWQKTIVRTETVSNEKSFVVTRALIAEVSARDVVIPAEYEKSGEVVIATVLNGYDIAKPLGKRVTRAEFTILTSLLEKEVARAVEKTLRRTYHTHALTVTAFAPLTYSVFRDIYAHEHDFLVLHVNRRSTDVVFVKRGTLVSISSIDRGINDIKHLVHSERRAAPGAGIEDVEKVWVEGMQSTFQDFSTQRALPRTLFLVARDEYRDYFKNLLDAPVLRSLWLTDEPLRIIPVTTQQFAPFVRTRGEAEGDVILSMMALFARTSQ